MDSSFRLSMAWLHTWGGVTLGAVLFAIFWTGTLTVFAEEIDRWMKPETRIVWDEARAANYSHDAVLAAALEVIGEEQPRDVWLMPPTPRKPVVRVQYRDAEGGWQGPLFLNPTTYEPLKVTASEAGTRFIYPFHYSLHIGWQNLGDWIVGIAAMAMLALLVSGVVIHRKIFAEFFTLRWERKLPRASLDLHNITGVLALPFHLVITFSGLVLAYNLYVPSVKEAVYGDDRSAFLAEAYGRFERGATGERAPLASLDAMVRQASEQWAADGPRGLWVANPYDTGGVVGVYRTRGNAVAPNESIRYFDAATGALLHVTAARPVKQVQDFFVGLHLILFDHWPIRWAYFVMGMMGCVLIATGYIYWLETRRKRHAAQNLSGVRAVEALTIGSVTGIVIATLAFFVVNRFLPPGARLEGAGLERAELEIWAFYLVWLGSFVHAWKRQGSALREQASAIVWLSSIAVLFNWMTTGDHLGRTTLSGPWAVAGMDAMLLGLAAVAAYVRNRLPSHDDVARAAHGAASRSGRSGQLEA
ncbi:MAG: PepSY-associated TM helix domain-containing protein [Pseudomonadota bacterium]